MRTWPGLVLVPVVALSHLAVNYALVPWSCVAGQGPLHVVALLALFVGLGVAIYQGVVWRRIGQLATPDPAAPRLKVLAGMSVLGASFFTLVIIGLWSAQWIVPPCVT